jgi:hypothetical protein
MSGPDRLSRLERLAESDDWDAKWLARLVIDARAFAETCRVMGNERAHEWLKEVEK